MRLSSVFVLTAFFGWTILAAPVPVLVHFPQIVEPKNDQTVQMIPRGQGASSPEDPDAQFLSQHEKALAARRKYQLKWSKVYDDLSYLEGKGFNRGEQAAVLGPLYKFNTAALAFLRSHEHTIIVDESNWNEVYRIVLDSFDAFTIEDVQILDPYNQKVAAALQRSTASYHRRVEAAAEDAAKAANKQAGGRFKFRLKAPWQVSPVPV